jgi:peptide/nickel transport system substrate-binding protein
MRRHQFCAVGLVLVSLGLGCARAPGPESGASGTGPNVAAPPPNRTLVLATRYEPPSLAAKPLRPVTSPGASVPLFNATLDYLDERGDARPYLAESLPELGTGTWQVAPDGTMTTSYHIRAGAAWHDGQPLTAQDFVFAWQVYANPEYGLAGSLPVSVMEQVEAEDDRAFTIRWRRIYPDAAALKQGFQPLPRHILQPHVDRGEPDAFANLPFWTTDWIGAGPYRLERWELGSYLEATAFDQHVLGRPKIGRIRLRFILDPNTVVANLLGGEVDASVDFAIRDEHLAGLRQDWVARTGGVIVASPVLFWATRIQLRPEYASAPALLDVRVRRAMAHAIDKATINDGLLNGQATIIDSQLPPGAAYYAAVERVIQKYPFDVRVTQQLLEEAGLVRGGDGIYLAPGGQPFRPELRALANPTQEAENAIIVDTLRRAGVDATSYVLPAASLQDLAQRATFPGMETGSGGGNIAGLDAYKSTAIAAPTNRWLGGNRNGWVNPEFDRFADLVNSTLDAGSRVQYLAEAQRIFTTDVPTIPHFYTPQYTIHVAALKGPMARQVPDPSESFNVWEWEWR